MGEVQEVDNQVGDERAGPDGRERRAGEQRLEQRRQGGLGDDTDGDARRRNSDLTGREIQFELLGHLPGAFEPRVAVDELGLGELSGARQRELDGHEETVREDEEYPRDESYTDLCWVHLCRCPVRSSATG